MLRLSSIHHSMQTWDFEIQRSTDFKIRRRGQGLSPPLSSHLEMWDFEIQRSWDFEIQRRSHLYQQQLISWTAHTYISKTVQKMMNIQGLQPQLWICHQHNKCSWSHLQPRKLPKRGSRGQGLSPPLSWAASGRVTREPSFKGWKDETRECIWLATENAQISQNQRTVKKRPDI